MTKEYNKESMLPSFNEALSTIEGVRGEINAMGANDSESESLNAIIRQLTDGDITPSKAVESAYEIRDSKQAYH